MVIAYGYDSIFYILFLHYIVVRESKSIFRGAAFLQFICQRLLLILLAVRLIGPWFLKRCMIHEQGLKNHAHVCSVDKTKRSYWLSIPRNNHWTLGLSNISQGTTSESRATPKIITCSSYRLRKIRARQPTCK